MLVEDDEQLTFITKRLLESRGYAVVTASAVSAAKEAMERFAFDLILLDMMLPDGTGTELCEEIRRDSTCPIIFLSCLSDNISKISALKMGGDDYITKPVNFEEMLARIQVNIRRVKEYSVSAQNPQDMSFPGLLLRKKKREAWLLGQDGSLGSLLELSPIEYSLLLCLAERAGELVLYQDLYQQVWQAEDLGDVRTVMVHVSNLRKKMGQSGKELIHTVRSAGYIFSDNKKTV